MLNYYCANKNGGMFSCKDKKYIYDTKTDKIYFVKTFSYIREYCYANKKVNSVRQ